MPVTLRGQRVNAPFRGTAPYPSLASYLWKSFTEILRMPKKMYGRKCRELFFTNCE